jgi:dTDP-4-amino-4,6-dideoxygalactose transaminase
VSKIPLVDVRAAYLAHKDEIDEAMLAVLDSADFINGSDVGAFEQEFARYCGTEHAIGVASGTAALHLVLHALGVGPGDEVLTTPHTFIATAEAISLLGAIPRFVDVDPTTGGLSAKEVERGILGAKAVLPVHLYGLPVDMQGILEVATAHGVPVVEDAAQAHGADVVLQDGSRPVGSVGRAGCFSFYPGKNMGCFGDGGAVTTNDAELARRIGRLRDHGRATKYEHAEVGYGYRLDTLQAAILRVKLRYLDAANQQRRRIAAAYTADLSDIGDLATMPTPGDRNSVHHLYVLRTSLRDPLLEHLRSSGVAAGVHYPVPLHLQPAYRHLGHGPGDFPEAEAWARECISLPMFPQLSESARQRVVEAVREFFGAR